MMEPVTQTQFVTALLDPDALTPQGLLGPDGAPAGKRFSVYRNNVAVSLTDALGQSFPVLQKIVGEEFFNALAGVFLRAHPPQSPLMMFYGAEMPLFLESFPPVEHLPYLADVARLELGIRHAYHAEDIQSIEASSLQNLSPDALMASHLTLAPAVKTLQSPWPLHAIYLANTQPDAPKVTPAAQDILITRSEFDPEVTLLPAGGAVFVQTLSEGATFFQAFEAAGETPEFDLSSVLGLLLSGGAITHIEQP